MKLGKFQKNIAYTTGFTSLTILIILYALILPAIAEIKKIDNDISVQNSIIELNYEKTKAIKSLNQKVKIIEPKLDMLDQVFISNNRELEFITTMEALAKKHEVTQNLNLGSKEAMKNKTYNKMSLSVTASGNYKNIMDYLIDIETMNYYVIIRSISIVNESKQENIEDGQKSSMVTLNINAETYWK